MAKIGSMITAMLQLAVDKCVQYEGAGYHLILYAAALVLLFVIWRREKARADGYILGYALFILAIYICPVTAKIITKLCIGKSVYWRMFWLMPVTLVLAYIAAYLVSKMKRPLARGLLAVALMAVLALSGRFMFRTDVYTPAENKVKLSQIVVDVADLVTADADAHKEVPLKGLFDDGLLPYIRQYNGRIKMAYGRDALAGYDDYDSFEAFHDEDTTAEEMLAICRDEGCGYLVLEENNRFCPELDRFVQDGKEVRFAGAAWQYKVYALN
ncbi:MAG: hypothetical protein Q4B73_03445 [Lachnospiraceae bacterium]|nr:hypothetical protein [Lachnospiraceae bacterium]